MIDDEDVYEYLEHFGVKGQRWGVRRARRQQKVIDRIRRTAAGTGSGLDKVASVLGTPIRGGAQKSAQRELDKNQRIQADIIAGRRKVQDILLRMGGVNIRNLDYSYDTTPQ